MNRDGTLDTTFNGVGKETIGLNLGGNDADEATGVAIQANGSILLSGTTNLAPPPTEPETDDTDFAVVRLKPNGTFDSTFGQNGAEVIAFDRGNTLIDTASAIALDPNSGIVVVGSTARIDGSTDFAVARLYTAMPPAPPPPPMPATTSASYTTASGTPLIVAAAQGVLANDTDPLGLPLTAIAPTAPAHGTLVLNPDGSFTYTPTTGFAGTDSFTYEASDGTYDSFATTVTIAVTGPPQVTAASYSVEKNQTLTVAAAKGVLANDTDPQGLPLTAIAPTNPAHGTLVLNSDGSFTYTPVTGFAGTDSFTYEASDGTLISAPATVSIVVQDTPPVSVNDSYVDSFNKPLVVPAALGVLSNDTDADGDTLTAIEVAGPAHGTVVLNADGSFTYTPVTGFSGTDSFTYKANDGDLNGNTASVTITTTTDLPPVAVNSSYVPLYDHSFTVGWSQGVLANDSDTNGEPLTAILIASPAHGTVVLNADGSFLYTPAAGYAGPDSFTYVASDGTLDSNIATASLTVRGGPPTALSDSYALFENSVLTQAASGGVLVNDTDPNGYPLTAVQLTGPAHGTLVLNPNGSFTYTPVTGFSGTDSFTYQAADGTFTSTSATVTLTVLQHPPIAIGESYSFSKNTTLAVTAAEGVLANDSDPYGDPLTAVQPTAPAHGTLVLNADGSFTYTPVTGFSGFESFTYEASNGTLDSTPATVILDVLDHPPTANADSYTASKGQPLVVSAAQGVLANDTDPDGDSLTALDLTNPAHGTLVLNADGSFIYTPAAGFSGTDSFTYEASDGTLDSTPATVTLDVVDHPPTANADSYTASKGQPLIVSAAQGVLANDTDPDGNSLTALDLTNPAHGTLVLNADGSFIYTPAAGFSGTDSFTYEASDGTLDSTSTTVTLGVVDHPPTANADSYTASKGQPLVVSAAQGGLANVTDPDGDSLTALDLTNPAHGALVLNTNGSFAYTPAAGFSGTDSFTYETSDGTLDSNPATVTLDVVDHPPTANADSYTASKGQPLVVSAPQGVLANDTDPDGDSLTALDLTNPAHGTLVLKADGSFIYTPAAGFSGTDSFTYEASDGTLDSNPATVSLDVVDHPPTANADSYTASKGQPLVVSGSPGSSCQRHRPRRRLFDRLRSHQSRTRRPRSQRQRLVRLHSRCWLLRNRQLYVRSQ